MYMYIKWKYCVRIFARTERGSFVYANVCSEILCQTNCNVYVRILLIESSLNVN